MCDGSVLRTPSASGRSTPNAASPPPPALSTVGGGGPSALRLLFGTLRGSPALLSPPGSAADVTKSHWKPDSEAGECFNLSCRKPFSFFERKHHCRRCGNIFCSACCSYIMRLTPSAEPSPEGKPHKVCSICINEHHSTLAQANDNDDDGGGGDGLEPRRKSMDHLASGSSDDNRLTATSSGERSQDDSDLGTFRTRRRTRSLREMKPGRRTADAAAAAALKTPVAPPGQPGQPQDAVVAGHGSYVWSSF